MACATRSPNPNVQGQDASIADAIVEGAGSGRPMVITIKVRAGGGRGRIVAGTAGRGPVQHVRRRCRSVHRPHAPTVTTAPRGCARLHMPLAFGALNVATLDGCLHPLHTASLGCRLRFRTRYSTAMHCLVVEAYLRPCGPHRLVHRHTLRRAASPPTNQANDCTYMRCCGGCSTLAASSRCRRPAAGRLRTPSPTTSRPVRARVRGETTTYLGGSACGSASLRHAARNSTPGITVLRSDARRAPPHGRNNNQAAPRCCARTTSDSSAATRRACRPASRRCSRPCGSGG